MCTRRKIRKAVATLLFFLYTIEIFASPLVVDPNTRYNTSLDTSATGVPIVNIATPNQRGVSVNEFVEYNIGNEGQVLNNADNVGRSHLAGIVNANPNLGAHQAASLVVLQVHGSNPSQLEGYLEALSRNKINVLLSNEQGIYSNGGGTIGIQRLTATTGKVRLEDGDVVGLDVRRGKISLGPKGWDLSRTDYVSLLANTVDVQGTLLAKESLEVVAGENQVDAKGRVQSKGSSSQGLAIDASALGGMYANQIKIISTDQGAGVRSDAFVVSKKQALEITAQGKVQVKQIQGKGIQVHAKEYVQKELASSEEGISIRAESISLEGKGTQATKDILLQGKVQNQAELYTGGSLQTKDFQNTADVQVEKKIQIEGKLENEGDLRAKDALSILGDASNRGTIVTQGAFAANKVENDKILVAKENMQVQQLKNRGKIGTEQELLVAGKLENAGEVKALGKIVVAEGVHNTGDIVTNASFTAKETHSRKKLVALDTIEVDTLQNEGSLLTQGRLLIHKNMENRGNIQVKKEIEGNGDVDNQGEILSSASFRAKNLQNQKTLLAKGKIETKHLNNEGVLGAGGDVVVEGNLKNTKTLEAKGLYVQGNSLHNQGEMKVERLEAKVDSVKNEGELLAFQEIALDTKELLNTNKIGALGDISAQHTKITNAGEILSNKSIELHGASVENRNRMAASRIGMTGLQQYQNTGSIHGTEVELQTEGDLQLTGNLHGESKLVVKGKRIQNTGNTSGKGEISFYGDSFSNQANLSSKQLQIHVKESLENKKVLSAKNLEIKAKDILNEDLIAGSEEVKIQAENVVENKEGKTIYAGKNLSIRAKTIHNQGGEILGDNLFLQAEQVRNEVGTLQAKKNIEIVSPKFENIGKVEDLDNYEYYYVTWDGRIVEEKDIPGWKRDFSKSSSKRSRGNAGSTIRRRQREAFAEIHKKVEKDSYPSLIFPKYTEELRRTLGNSGEYTKQTGSAEIPSLALTGKVRSKGKTSHGKVLAGGNISIQAKEVLNQDGMISAGGKVSIDAEKIENVVTTGEKIKVKDGREKMLVKFERTGRKPRKKVRMEVSYTRDFAPDTIRKRVQVLDERGEPVRSPLGRKKYKYVEEYIGRYAYVTGQPSVIEGKKVLLDASKLVTQSIAEANGSVQENVAKEHNFLPQDVHTGISKNKETLALANPKVEARIPALEAKRRLEIASNLSSLEDIKRSGKIEVLPSLPSALFVKSVSPSSKYIMETRGQYVNISQYYGSDYFLQKIGYEETWDRVKRLGDAFYENQLLERSIVEKLGTRFLQGKEVSMKQLLDNGVVAAKSQGLRIGEALTETQRKQLKQDMVWYEKEQIDGVSVLVPRIYLSATTLEKLRMEGSNQIGGTEGTSVKTGELRNTGVLGNEGLTYIEADRVQNRSLSNQMARIQGENISVLAKQDIQNIGGSIAGSKEVNLFSKEGAIVNRSTLQKTEYEYGEFDRTKHTAIDSIAEISSGGSLQIQGKGYRSLAALTNAKNAKIEAEEVQIGAQTLEGEQKFGSNGNSFQSYAMKKYMGSHMEVGDLQVKANNMNIEGSTVLAKEATLDVESLSVDSRVNQEDRVQTSKETSLFKTVSKTKIEHQETNVAGVLAVEGKAEIAGDVKVEGSTLVLGKDSAIKGTLETDSKVTRNQYVTEEKKKGFSSNFSASGFSLSYGKSKFSYEEKDKTNIKSNVVLGDGTQLQKGANITATNLQHGDIRIQGGDVLYGARKDEKDITTKSKSSSFGLSFHVSSPVLERAKQARDAAKQVGNGDALGGLVNIGNAVTGTVAGLAGNIRNQKGKQATLQDIQNGSVSSNNQFYLQAGVSAGYNRRKQESNSHQESAVVTHITGLDKDAKITYNDMKNVTYQGTQANNTTFVYNDVENIRKEAVELRNTSSSQGSASGIGVSAGLFDNNASVSLNVSASKNKQNTEESVYQNGSFQNVNEIHNNTGTMILSGFNQEGGRVTGEIGKVEIASLQNTSTTKGKSKGANLGIPLTGGIPTGSVSFTKTTGDRAFVDKQSSFVVGENSDLTIGKMENTAAIVGTQGNGKIQIDRYIGKNVENQEDLTTKGGSIGTGGVGIQYSDAEKEGITRNTVVGNVEIGSASGETINTDPSKANEITKDTSTSTNVYVEKQLLDAVTKPKEFQDKVAVAKKELESLEDSVTKSIDNLIEGDKSQDISKAERRQLTEIKEVVIRVQNAKEIRMIAEEDITDPEVQKALGITMERFNPEDTTLSEGVKERIKTLAKTKETLGVFYDQSTGKIFINENLKEEETRPAVAREWKIKEDLEAGKGKENKEGKQRATVAGEIAYNEVLGRIQGSPSPIVLSKLSYAQMNPDSEVTADLITPEDRKEKVLLRNTHIYPNLPDSYRTAFGGGEVVSSVIRGGRAYALVKVGVVLLAFPEPATSVIGAGLIAYGTADSFQCDGRQPRSVLWIDKSKGKSSLQSRKDIVGRG